jgi:hypothetical protein
VTFLAYVREDDADWHALFATIAVTGIRRGEAVGAAWAATDLGAGTLEIRQTITKAGSKVVVKSPKSGSCDIPGGRHAAALGVWGRPGRAGHSPPRASMPSAIMASGVRNP